MLFFFTQNCKTYKCLISIQIWVIIRIKHLTKWGIRTSWNIFPYLVSTCLSSKCLNIQSYVPENTENYWTIINNWLNLFYIGVEDYCMWLYMELQTGWNICSRTGHFTGTNSSNNNTCPSTPCPQVPPWLNIKLIIIIDY